MKDTLFVPVVALSTLSAALAIAITACAAQALHTFNLDQPEDIWLLPIWRDHFDTRDLQAFVGAGAFITISSILILALTLAARSSNTVVNLIASSLGAIATLIALILSNVLVRHSPERDTLQTWTCSWISDTAAVQQGLSSDFTTTCRATRTAFYGIIPLFLLQLALIACVALGPVLRRRAAGSYGNAIEKGYASGNAERQSSWDSRDSSKTGAMELVRPVREG